MSEIEVFYDIISPYSFLALELLDRSSLKDEHDVILTPVALGSILQMTGNPGPAGVEAKRGEALRDCCMQAQRQGVQLLGPPAHPFNTLPALRFITCIEDQAERYEVAIKLNRACWSEGKDISTDEGIEAVLCELGLMKDEWKDVYNFIKENKGRPLLKQATSRALELKVFGVPTFRIDDEMNIWGSDRFELIEDYIKRPDFYSFEAYERMLNINSGM
ncbi:DSBA oxidoreductase [Lentisphaera araneosa HTCC2155]|uniref:2-hydroxychromene-2-carboxylate isomerase n=1 Tax=Lentisphaera araneosa HTCC2155 TaxID=313628 RepID=A6DFD1_9BACT|nr:DsbA family protein [Lentisphaera araneosa]EDM29511.1 DSBA oxidoreductase [Lentisphaera araneosa HTCC2155]